MKKLKTILSIISGVALLVFLYKLFSTKSAPISLEPFPQADEKKAVEADIKEEKKELEQLETKEYSDEEIEKKFNE
jgi:hypothetical protein